MPGYRNSSRAWSGKAYTFPIFTTGAVLPAVLARCRKTCLADSSTPQGKFFSLQGPGQDFFARGSSPGFFPSTTPAKPFLQNSRPKSSPLRRPANFFPLKAPQLLFLEAFVSQGSKKEGGAPGRGKVHSTACHLLPRNPAACITLQPKAPQHHHHQAEAEIFSLEASGQALFPQ